MTDKYDELTGDDLDQAFNDNDGPGEGGSNADGTYNAEEKRDFLRDAAAEKIDTRDDDDDDDLRDPENPFALTDGERAAAQMLPATPGENAALRDAHARNDTNAIREVTSEATYRREREYAQGRDGE